MDIDVRALVPSNLIVKNYSNYDLINCPWHPDNHPSLRVYSDGCYCPACAQQRTGLELYSRLYGISLRDSEEAIKQLQVSGRLPTRHVVTKELVVPPQSLGLMLHQQLTDEAMEYLVVERGLYPETIQEYQLGWGSLYSGGPKGITIPIYVNGKLRQVKQRLLRENHNKYRSLSGCGTWFYLGEDLSNRTEGVFITEGEFDAIVLRQYGFLAGTSTGGAARFDRSWSSYIKNSIPIYGLFDNDAAGQRGFERFNRLVGGYIRRVLLPTKDLTEFFKQSTKEEFLSLIKDTDDRY